MYCTSKHSKSEEIGKYVYFVYKGKDEDNIWESSVNNVWTEVCLGPKGYVQLSFWIFSKSETLLIYYSFHENEHVGCECGSMDMEFRVNPYGSGAQFFPSPILSLTSGTVVSLLFSQAVDSERRRSTPQCGLYSKLPKLSGPKMQSILLPTSQNCRE